MGRGWRRVRGTPPGVQTWESEPYDTSIEAADPNLLAPADFQHAQDQLTIANQYPGRQRSQPSAKVIKNDTGNRSPKT